MSDGRSIDERIAATAEDLRTLARMQLETEKRLVRLEETTQKLIEGTDTTTRNLNLLTREMRQLRHFVLSMGAKIELPPLHREDEPQDGAA